MNKEIDPPYMPNVFFRCYLFLIINKPNEDNFDFRQTMNNDQWKDTNPEIQKQNSILLRRNSVQG